MPINIRRRLLPELRDISSDLAARVSIAEARIETAQSQMQHRIQEIRDEFEREIADARAERSAAKALQEIEERRLGRSALPPSSPEPGVSLDDFFVRTVEEKGRRSKAELRDDGIKAGYFTQETAGRATHATLMNIVRAGRIIEIDKDMYTPAHKPGEFALTGDKHP